MFEKVNPQHPDKVADRIAGAIVDLAYSRAFSRSGISKGPWYAARSIEALCYTKSEWPKVAAEVLLGHGLCSLQIETSERLTAEELEAIVHRIAGEEVEVRALIVPQDVHLADNQAGAVRCGDNGIFRGCAPTHEQRLLTAIATSIYDRYPTDGKYIIASGWHSDSAAYDVTICQSNVMTRDEERAICDMLVEDYRISGAININPLGPWTGGTDVDCGATNRKLGSDMGDGVTGGGLHGKDLSKADVSVNIWAYLESIRTGREVTACCSIGDETVCGIPYRDIVEQARLYIHTLGGFERFAEWGLIRVDRESESRE